MAKKAIIGIVVILVVIIVAAFALSGGSREDEPDMAYDYTATIQDSLGFDRPDEGKQFLVIDYALKNLNADDISTNFMFVVWTATLDGIIYSQDDWVSVSHPDYQLVHIEKGYTAYSGAVIQVPAGHEVGDFEITMQYDIPDSAYTEIRDDTLM